MCVQGTLDMPPQDSQDKSRVAINRTPTQSLVSSMGGSGGPSPLTHPMHNNRGGGLMAMAPPTQQMAPPTQQMGPPATNMAAVTHNQHMMAGASPPGSHGNMGMSNEGYINNQVRVFQTFCISIAGWNVKLELNCLPHPPNKETIPVRALI